MLNIKLGWSPDIGLFDLTKCLADIFFYDSHLMLDSKQFLEHDFFNQTYLKVRDLVFVKSYLFKKVFTEFLLKTQFLLGLAFKYFGMKSEILYIEAQSSLYFSDWKLDMNLTYKTEKNGSCTFFFFFKSYKC